MLLNRLTFFLAQTTTSSETVEGPNLLLTVFWVAIVLAVYVIPMWILFAKADQPGWAAIIPLYNLVVWLEIVGRPIWWIILLFIPFVNIIVSLTLCVDLARSFGKGTGYGCGVFILPFIFLPLLAFTDADYEGPAAA
jgi:hypothetical protein